MNEFNIESRDAYRVVRANVVSTKWNQMMESPLAQIQI